jgi:hypothetical protein
MDWLPTVGVLVGIISGLTGTAFGVYNFINLRRQSQRQIMVKLDDSGFMLDGTVSKFIIVTAANTGFRSVILTEAGILLPDNRKLVIPVPVYGPTFPHQLIAGASYDLMMDAEKVAQSIKDAGFGAGVAIWGCYRDALGTLYRSKPLHFHPERFIAAEAPS